MRKKIGVLMGGISSEREVSLMSSRSMIEHLDRDKFEVIPIEINKKEDVFLKCQEIDFALIGLHGEFGENGCVQSILSAMDIPYSGCGPLPSALALDKDTSKKILRFSGVRTADWVIIKGLDNIDYDKIEEISYPMFVKPNSGGSSIATNLVRKREDLAKAIREALQYDSEVMIEAYIGGYEITIPMIDGKIYPILAIETQGEFFDFISKYKKVKDGGANLYVLELDELLRREVVEMAYTTWHELKLESYARIDMLVQDNVPYLLEANTLPGMTSKSLLPTSYTSLGEGHTYTDLLTKLIEVSWNLKSSKKS